MFFKQPHIILTLMDINRPGNNADKAGIDIIVCVKQVPGTASIEVDPVTGVLRRDAQNAKLNPYDLYAVEAALELSAKAGGRVTAISMGPPQAREALLETIYMGADRAVLINDKRFAGSDVLATAYTLSQAAASIGYDLIICGKQTTDGDTAQVGAEMAEFLGIPHAAYVRSIQPADANAQPIRPIMGGVIVVTENEYNVVTQYMPLPCLLCADGGVNTPRLPSYKRKRELGGDPVQILTLADLADKNESHYGLAGSPTQVERTYTPDKKTDREVITGSGAQLAARLRQILAERK